MGGPACSLSVMRVSSDGVRCCEGLAGSEVDIDAVRFIGYLQATDLYQQGTLWSEDVPDLCNWMQRINNLGSGDVQNEILQIMPHNALHSIASDIRVCGEFSLVVDKTADSVFAEGRETISCTVKQFKVIHNGKKFDDLWTEMTEQAKIVELEESKLPRIRRNPKRYDYNEFPKFKALHPETRYIFPELEKVLKLLLVVPISSVTAKRSSSMLRRIKTFLRCTISESRLTHMCILNESWSSIYIEAAMQWGHRTDRRTAMQVDRLRR
ncbi:hypothetical protein PR048_029869 [Dryococelus australis]|uniref:HAT C-terminal dimerisation domain-containing protein n=1 Tax=Dryococelus australis TaxID=614101 RepID=A0ABQ9G7W0_9NEOP|nr:hypothetical protein PR048_029869 [Dryococelus australis]